MSAAATDDGPEKRTTDAPVGETKEERRKRRKKSRWGDEGAAAVVPVVAANASKTQQELVLARFRIVEINKQLATPDLGIPKDVSQRSPSPEPIYDGKGVRINTREFRTRNKLQQERQTLVVRAMQLDVNYVPPSDFKAQPVVIEDKIVVPQSQYADINFIGLLIGPRGNTLKDMEKSSGAKIMIRGKGSVKPGKGRQGGQPVPGEDEELHALVRAPDEASFKKAVDRINKIIKMAIDCPEEQNQLKKQQLELLAKMNGTFREDSIFSGCGNCGSTEHRDWQCPNQKNAVTSIVCKICGGAGHVEADCKQGGGDGGGGGNNADKAKMDREFALFLKDLGEDVPEEALKEAEAPKPPEPTHPYSNPHTPHPSRMPPGGPPPHGQFGGLRPPVPPGNYGRNPPLGFGVPSPHRHSQHRPQHPWGPPPGSHHQPPPSGGPPHHHPPPPGGHHHHQPPPPGGHHHHQPPPPGGHHQPPPPGGQHQPPRPGGQHQPPPPGGHHHQPPPPSGHHQPPPPSGHHQPPPPSPGDHHPPGSQRQPPGDHRQPPGNHRQPPHHYHHQQQHQQQPYGRQQPQQPPPPSPHHGQQWSSGPPPPQWSGHHQGHNQWGGPPPPSQQWGGQQPPPPQQQQQPPPPPPPSGHPPPPPPGGQPPPPPSS